MEQKPERKATLSARFSDGCRTYYDDGTIEFWPKGGGPMQTYRWEEEKPGMPVLQDFERAIANAVPIPAAEDTDQNL